MAFTGFRGDFIGFFRGLGMDNSKAYFERHRAAYERDVRAPMVALTEALAPELGPVKLFRINRDIRFSADKSPYKTNAGALVGPLYIHLDARRFFLGTGNYHPERDWLARYREAVAGPAGADFAEIVDAGRRSGLTYAEADPLRTAPKGYAADHPRIELLRWRNVVAGRSFEIEPWIASEECLVRVRATWAEMKPFSDWLTAQVG